MGRLIEQRGFTLVEAMAVLLITAVMLAIAIPGFRAVAQSSQQRNVMADVNGMLSRMRTEVAASRLGLTACASADQQTCSGTPNWEEGWIVFIDGLPGFSANGAHDAGETIIQVHAPLPQGVTLRTIGPPSALTLNSLGLPVQQATFRYCDERGLSSLRALVVGPTGMVRLVTDGRDHNGAAIAACQ